MADLVSIIYFQDFSQTHRNKLLVETKICFIGTNSHRYLTIMQLKIFKPMYYTKEILGNTFLKYVTYTENVRYIGYKSILIP